MALNEQEKSVVRRAFQQGPSALLDDGYTNETMREFLERPDVKAEWALLQSEFDNQDALSSRTKFVAKRQIARLVPGAVAVLAQALAGPVYARDKSGNVLIDAKGRSICTSPEMTEIQLAAASQILERMGVSSDKPVDRSSDVNVNLLFSKAESTGTMITVDADPSLQSEEERSLSRERMRNAMERLLKKLPEAKDKLSLACGNAPKSAPGPKPKKKSKANSKKIDTVSTATE